MEMKAVVAVGFQAYIGTRQRDECEEAPRSSTDGIPTKSRWKILQHIRDERGWK